MKKTLLIISIFTTSILFAQTKISVNVQSNSFTPSAITINVGDTVEWTNTGGSHNVNGTTATFPSNPESFGNSVGAGWTFTHIFNTAGSYNYQCNPHAGSGMTGTITVTPPASVKISVNVQSNSFTPSALTINVGDTVEWTNTGGSHNVNGTTVTFPSNPESFGNSVGAGWTFTHVFNTAGNYNYQCNPHAGLGMTGTITVGTTTSVITQIETNELNFYPNPAKDKISFSDYKNITNITVYSLTGKKVIEVKVISENLDVSELSTGTYFVKIFSNEKEITKKLIIQ